MHVHTWIHRRKQPELLIDICCICLRLFSLLLFLGNVLQPGAGALGARIAALLGGLPLSTSVHTVNRQCSSGLQAVAAIAGKNKTREREGGSSVAFPLFITIKQDGQRLHPSFSVLLLFLFLFSVVWCCFCWRRVYCRRKHRYWCCWGSGVDDAL